MSKAFTREDDREEEPDDVEAEAEAELEREAAQGKKRYITEAGFKKLEAEVAHLWSVERPKITQEVADAAAQGDRSENAEYIYGKRKLRQIDGRIRYLSKLLDRLNVVIPEPSQHGRAFFGAWVTLADEDDNEVTYRLVGPDETDIRSGAISVESPVGKALLGKREGDEVVVERPKGRAEYTVVSIRY